MQTLKRVRRERGMSQEDLAEAAGLSRQVVSNLERGTSHGYPETWKRLATALGVTVDELLEDSEAPKGRSPLPSESKALRDWVAAASGAELRELREQLHEERVRLHLLHRDQPEDRSIHSEYLRAMERHQYLGWALAARQRAAFEGTGKK